MTVFRLQPHACERAREWTSLRLDGELSELEQVLLASHLDRCAGCSAYAAGVSAVTEGSARALQAGTGAAAVLAAAVGLGTLFGSSGPQAPSLSANAVRLSSSAIHAGPNSEQDALIQVPKIAMLRAEQGVGKQRGLGLNV